MGCSMPGIPGNHRLPEFTEACVHRVSDGNPTITSSVVPFSSCLRSFPASGYFLMSQFFASGGQSIAASASVLPVNIQDWFPLRFTGLFRTDWFDLLAVRGTLKSFLQHRSSDTSILRHSTFFLVQISHLYMTTGKTIAWTRQTFVDKAMSVLYSMLSRFVIAFLPRSNCLLILTVSIVSPYICHEVILREYFI